jgi:hypothetical protein
MHSSLPSEKISYQHAAQRDGGDGLSDDGMTKRNHRRTDRSKPRNKRDYSQQRKLKEKFLVFSS